jgi:hypothetical protein
MCAGNDAIFLSAGLNQGRPQGRQAIASGNCADKRRIRFQGSLDQLKRHRKIVDSIERPDRDAQIKAILTEVVTILLNLKSAGTRREKTTRIGHINSASECGKSVRPVLRGAAQKQCPLEAARDIAQPIQTLVEDPIEQEHFRAGAGGALSSQYA